MKSLLVVMTLALAATGCGKNWGSWKSLQAKQRVGEPCSASEYQMYHCRGDGRVVMRCQTDDRGDRKWVKVDECDTDHRYYCHIGDLAKSYQCR